MTTSLLSSLNSSTPTPIPTPAPAPSPNFVTVIQDIRLLGILLSVIITTMLLLFLFFVGRVRRCVRGGWVFKYSTKISYLLVPISITYVMGQMHNASQQHVWFPIWAGALIYAYGGVVTMTACDLRDNEDTLKYVWRTLPLVFYTVWLVLLVSTTKQFSLIGVCAVVFFLVLAAINARQTLLAFYRASRSKGMPALVEPTVEYLTRGGDVVPDHVDPRSMRGYKYLVWGHPTQSGHENMVTTTEEIWQWVSTSPQEQEIWQSLAIQQEQEQQHEQQEAFHSVTITEEEEEEAASSRQRRLVGRVKFLGNCAAKEHLRDLCLSHALFRMLVTRFAGFSILQESRHLIHRKRFILEGLLCSPEPQRSDVERVFHIIEVELDFLFDLFYTKSHVCSSYRFRDILLHLAHIGLLWIFAIVGIKLIGHSDSKEDLQIPIFKTHHLEVIVTRCVVILFALLEFWKYVMANYSNRKIVWLLCTAIGEAKVGSKWARITEMRLIGIWKVKYYLSRLDLFLLFSKPWQRKLGQYSFLESYSKGKLLSRKFFSPLNVLVKLPRVGQHGGFSVPLSKNVKRAIVSSLLRNQLVASQQTNTIRRHHLTEEISTPFGNHPDTDARFILEWHIATSFCESLHPPQNTHDEHFLVATQLSKYCAHLLTFAPELLPGHPYTTERTFDKAVQQAHKHFHMNGLTMDERYQILIAYHNDDSNNNNNNNQDDKIVVTGAVLARALIRGVIRNPNRGWKVLAEFWAELLLYLAPSDKVEGHAQYLAKGGEFITHLWTLLSHAGVLTTTRPSSPTV